MAQRRPDLGGTTGDLPVGLFGEAPQETGDVGFEDARLLTAISASVVPR